MSKLILRLVTMNELRIDSDVLYTEQVYHGYRDDCDDVCEYLVNLDYSIRVINTILRVDL